MISAIEIKEKLSLVSMGKLSLDAFEDWFVPNAWNAHKSSSSEAIELVSAIHLLLSERDDRILNEADLRNALVGLLNNVVHIPVRYVEEVPVHTLAVTWSRSSNLRSVSAQVPVQLSAEYV